MDVKTCVTPPSAGVLLVRGAGSLSERSCAPSVTSLALMPTAGVSVPAGGLTPGGLISGAPAVGRLHTPATGLLLASGRTDRGTDRSHTIQRTTDTPGAPPPRDPHPS